MEHHSRIVIDDSRGVIYDCKIFMFMVQAQEQSVNILLAVKHAQTMALGIMALGIMALCIMALGIMALGIMALSIMALGTV